MEIILGILAFCGISFSVWAFFQLRKKKTIDAAIEQENQQLDKQRLLLVGSIEKLVLEKDLIEKSLKEKQEQLNNNEEILNNSFQRYISLLENDYEGAEEEYDILKEKLTLAYNNLQDSLMKEQERKNQELSNQYSKNLKEIEEIQQQLKKLQDMRSAAIKAHLREEEMKDKMAFYSLTIDSIELADIEILESIRPRLAKPRVLSMLIWSTFYQKPMTTLCNNILGVKDVCGVYKITNQKNNMCYIGQATSVSTRWKEHAKCGLGIDTPANNKLYQAMQKDGIYNFTWELLEECDRSLLNEKERKYIELYQANEFGYNSTKGNK
jgi:hypothetical protein